MLIDVKLVRYLDYGDWEDISKITCTVAEVCQVLQVFFEDVRFHEPHVGIEIAKHED